MATRNMPRCEISRVYNHHKVQLMRSTTIARMWLLIHRHHVVCTCHALAVAHEDARGSD